MVKSVRLKKGSVASDPSTDEQITSTKNKAKTATPRSGEKKKKNNAESEPESSDRAMHLNGPETGTCDTIV